MTTLTHDHGLASPGLDDLRPATPKRWPINAEVIDSLACAMPQYAGYRTAFYLVEGSALSCSADTLDDLLDKAVPWARASSRIVRVPMIPYYDTERDSGSGRSGRPVGSAPWAGGTWGGLCGATMWVTDPDLRYRDTFATLHGLGNGHYMQDYTTNGDISKMQAWWVNGVAARKPELDGFPVECRQTRRHDGLCTALDIEWDWRDYAPYADLGAGRQIALF